MLVFLKRNTNMADGINSLLELPSDPLDLLSAFGLSRQEATVYLSLLSEGGLNGYEAAKTLGISRSNAYTALASLVEKGAAWTAEGTPVRYVPVPAAEFTENRVRKAEAFRKKLLACLPGRKEIQGGYVTITGTDLIFDRLRHLIADAEERVYLAVPGTVLGSLLGELATLLASGKKVVIITDSATVADAGLSSALSGATVYAGDVAPLQIRAIADSRFVLTGELSGGKGASCLFSDRKNLVDIFKTALKNEIRLIELGASATGGKSDGVF
jgi:HTH-type transcriptional regulator, sugar sensing transcriptional regulator